MNALQQAAHAERETNRITRPLTVAPATHKNLATPATMGRVDQLDHKTLVARRDEAREQIAYWKAARFRAEGRDKPAAGARVQLWQMHLSAVEARLHEIEGSITANPALLR